MSEETQVGTGPGKPKSVLMPAPTAWPFCMAMGTALMLTGLLTDVSVSILGAIFWISGAVGWFRQVLPHEVEEALPVQAEAPPPVLPTREVKRLPSAAQVERAWLPLRIYPVSAGVKGGLAGGVAMAIFAVIYGIVAQHSVWYPINLLAGSLYAPSATPSIEEMRQFHMGWLLFATAMHVTMCLLVGLLYGAMLPLLPRRPIVLGGIIGPLLWTGLLYHVIGYVNPLLDQRINWWWFAVSQAAFGIVAGLVVSRHHQVWTAENIPLAMRAGIEAPGLMEERDDEGKR
ncbi:MAG TPA: hypothetical protein VKB58_14715 [Terriglobales bacterium]|jgi:hypothetical protein|nr:hypothetical protein [Terriglobales bacterium]